MKSKVNKRVKQPVFTIQGDSNDIFIRMDDMPIAKRGHPGTPHAKTWIPLEPGFVVRDVSFPDRIEIEFNGARVH